MGKPKQSIIEINGKRYDVRTGRLADSKPVAKPAQKASIQTAKPAKSRAVNDITRKPQRSQTLMRTGLKRPASAPRVSAIKQRTISDIGVSAKATARTILPSKTEAQRLVRAAKVQQSNLVRKFGDVISPGSFPSVNTRIESLPVQPAPLSHKPVNLKPSGSTRPTSPAASRASTGKLKSESLIERGLRNANAHEQPKPKLKTKSKSKTKKKRGKVVAYAGGTLVALSLIGLVAYQNIPRLAIRYAAARSGIEAAVPNYQPAGFSLSPTVKYTPGHVELSYESNSDERTYSVIQKESAWNSDELRSNFVLGASDGAHPQTYEDKGRKIYLYGDGNAAWVSQGVMYEIKGEASKLTSDQIIRIATSL